MVRLVNSIIADALLEYARRDGMRTLREDGVEKIRSGLTSVAEVLRVLGTAGR